MRIDVQILPSCSMHFRPNIPLVSSLSTHALSELSFSLYHCGSVRITQPFHSISSAAILLRGTVVERALCPPLSCARQPPASAGAWVIAWPRARVLCFNNTRGDKFWQHEVPIPATEISSSSQFMASAANAETSAYIPTREQDSAQTPITATALRSCA